MSERCQIANGSLAAMRRNDRLYIEPECLNLTREVGCRGVH
jgi:hypothetical protein